MADLSAGVQRPNAANIITPNYQACSAADKFLASLHGGYMLHYKNGATLAGAVYINEKQLSLPPQGAPTAPAGSLKWSDYVVHAAFPATAERIVFIDDITPYIDTLGFVNMQHLGTITTMTVAILGPM